MVRFSAVGVQFSPRYKQVALVSRRADVVGKRCGDIGLLLEAWRAYVHQQGDWHPHLYEGYRPVAVDLTGFWRLRLKGWTGKYFNGLARQMIKGIGFALVVDVGQLAGQRLPLLLQILRADSTQRTAKDLKQKALKWAGDNLADDEVFIFEEPISVTWSLPQSKTMFCV